jgi:hypothetical protein
MSDSQWQDDLTPVLRQLQIIVGAMVFGCACFLVVVLALTGGKGAEGETGMISYLAVAFTVMALITRIIVPGMIVAQGRQTIRQTTSSSRPDQGLHTAGADSCQETADARRLFSLLTNSTIAAAALVEAPAFFAIMAYLLEQPPLSLILAVLLILGVATHMPTQSRATNWIEGQLRLLREERQLGP